MNYPTITCYISDQNKKYDTDLINAFRKLGYEPLVNSLYPPSYEKVKGSKNTIVYLWTTDPPSLEGLIALPVEKITERSKIAAIQIHPRFLTPFNREIIGNYLGKLLTTNEKPAQTKKIVALAKQGCFSLPEILVSKEVHEPRHVIIKDGVEKDAGDLSEFVTEEFKKFSNK